MPKGNLGGNKKKKGKKGGGEARELAFKEDEQEYAQVTKMLGDGRFNCYCFDGVQRLGHIRGKLRHKVWINVGDIVLVSLREYQDYKCDAFHKYNPDEVKRLREYGEIPDSVKIYLKANGDEDESVIFDYANEEMDNESSEYEEGESEDENLFNLNDENDETIQKKIHSLREEEEMIENEIMDKMRKITMKGGIQLDELKRRDSIDDI